MRTRKSILNEEKRYLLRALAALNKVATLPKKPSSCPALFCLDMAEMHKAAMLVWEAKFIREV